jgi:hypothetical protein
MILDSSDPPLTLTFMPDEQIELATRSSDLVVVARVIGIESTLTPAQDWIRSRHSIRVIDVLKQDARKQIVRGATLSFDVDGGEMSIGAARIIAKVPWAVGTFQSGKQYLMFVVYNEAGEILADPGGSYELTPNGKFAQRREKTPGRAGADVAATPYDRDVIEEGTQKEVFAKIRAVVKPWWCLRLC